MTYDLGGIIVPPLVMGSRSSASGRQRSLPCCAPPRQHPGYRYCKATPAAIATIHLTGTCIAHFLAHHLDQALAQPQVLMAMPRPAGGGGPRTAGGRAVHAAAPGRPPECCGR